jgi:hypothetical protein
VSAERYTVVFTGFFDRKPGEYLYLSMGGSLAPGNGTLYRGRPPYERMGCEIPFGDLPEDCQRLVLNTYRELWDL